MTLKIALQLKQFLVFAFFSGIGWLLDFFVFSLMEKVFEFSDFWSNFVSSYVGVSFVWFGSLKAVFNQESKGNFNFLIIYWVYQLISILFYSMILHTAAQSIEGMLTSTLLHANSGILAKIIITPFNLLTNFLFMKLLMYFICQRIVRDE